MTNEPQEIRLRRTGRSDALRRARDVVAKSHVETPATVTPIVSVLDEAFAELPDVDTKPATEQDQKVTGELVSQIASQLQQLDQQRQQLASLLAGLDSGDK